MDWVLCRWSRDAVHRCGPAIVECTSLGEIAGVNPVKGTPASCGHSPARDDDSPISGHDDASSSDEDVTVSIISNTFNWKWGKDDLSIVTRIRTLA